jgi:hypothetical protein
MIKGTALRLSGPDAVASSSLVGSHRKLGVFYDTINSQAARDCAPINIIETGRQNGLVTEQPAKVIKKLIQPEPPTSAIQIPCRVCGASKGALCTPVNGWIGPDNVHWARAADFENSTWSLAV